MRGDLFANDPLVCCTPEFPWLWEAKTLAPVRRAGWIENLLEQCPRERQVQIHIGDLPVRTATSCKALWNAAPTSFSPSARGDRNLTTIFMHGYRAPRACCVLLCLTCQECSRDDIRGIQM